MVVPETDDSHDELGSSTSITLLQGMRERDPEQWERFALLFSPLVYEWCRRANVNQHDAADVTQEVFKAVALTIDSFRRDRDGDTFRGWLWGITRYKILDHFRAAAQQPTAIGGSSAQIDLNEIVQRIPEAWDDQQSDHDSNALYKQALDLLQSEFEQATWNAFLEVTVHGRKPADVAKDLGMTVGAVYNARYKVMRRLRNDLEGFL